MEPSTSSFCGPRSICALSSTERRRRGRRAFQARVGRELKLRDSPTRFVSCRRKSSGRCPRVMTQRFGPLRVTSCLWIWTCQRRISRLATVSALVSKVRSRDVLDPAAMGRGWKDVGLGLKSSQFLTFMSSPLLCFSFFVVESCPRGHEKATSRLHEVHRQVRGRLA